VRTGHTEIADVEWKDHGLWAIDTANPSSWTTAEARIMNRTTADVALVQESKAFGDLGVQRVRNTGRALGWNCAASPALRTACDKGSGGCVVAGRRGAGLTPHPDSLVQDGYAHRIKFAWYAGLMRGGAHFGSIYLKDSSGLSDENVSTLQQVAAALRTLRGPWVIGG